MNATQSTKKTKAAGAVSIVLGVLAMLALFLPASAHGAPGEHKVTLCHATHSRTNPYVEITVDYHSITKAGHGDHAGPVFDATLAKDVAWGDIIPPFQLGGEDYPGLNWTAAGQAILAAGCAVAEPPVTTAPPTTTPPVTEPVEHKVTLCHATASHTNPYVLITVDYHSVIQAGHGDHTGPVYDPTLAKGTAWGDIIPSFDFGGDAVFAGLNWGAAGQAIFAAGCVVPDVTPTTTPTTTTPTTTAPTTTEAPTTTTTTEAPTTTTTAANDLVDFAIEGAGSSINTEAETRVLGASAAPAPADPQAAQVLGAQQARPTTATGSLPITGVDSGLLLAVALMLVTGGLVLVRHARQHQV